ncbi:MAG: SDR family NAD(P)-dependent oxidoreductase, partial [Burkholderiales bacterium]
MTPPVIRPKRKNPVLRTRQINLPPSARSRVALGLTAAAAMGRFELQQCADCQAVLYPPREACPRCAGARLRWREQGGEGELLAGTTLHHSNDLFFRERLPWRLGLVKLDVGPTLMVHWPGSVVARGDGASARVRVAARLDRAGQAVLIALPEKEFLNMADDPMLREMASDPKARKVLVTDGMTAVGQALVREFVKSGAELIWVGHAEPWKQHGSGLESIAALPQVALVPLDLTDGRSVQALAGEIGAKVDIVVNNAEVHRAFSISARRGTDVAKLEMEVNYFGALRLAQAFGPALAGRSADGAANACAWVNLLSIYALANFPPHGTYSASKAAAHSLAQCQRAELRGAGIR